MLVALVIITVAKVTMVAGSESDVTDTLDWLRKFRKEMWGDITTAQWNWEPATESSWDSVFNEEETFSWSDWADFSNVWTDIEWDSYSWGNSFDSDWSESSWNNFVPVTANWQNLLNTHTPANQAQYHERLGFDMFWTSDPYNNWCKATWKAQRLHEYWEPMIDEFLASGNITLWCLSDNQVMAVTDLANTNINDPVAIPSMFMSKMEDHCTYQVCSYHMMDRAYLVPEELISRTWRIMELYRKINCRTCFCESDTLRELSRVMSITKDHLKKNVFLGYKVTDNTPADVAEYYRNLARVLELDHITPHPFKRYRELLTMEEAIEGPGNAARHITSYAQLAHGIFNFCEEAS